MCQDEYLTQPNERLPRGDADIPCNGEPSCQVCGSVPDVQRACDADNRCQGARRGSCRGAFVKRGLRS